jgi:hypothetical protein
MNLRKLAICTVTFIGVIFNFSNDSFAHYPTGSAIGSESAGYLVKNYGHAGRTIVNYAISSSVDSTYRTYISNGASKWNNTGVIAFNNSSSAIGTFYKYRDDSTSTVAAFYDPVTSANHYTSWKIELNAAIMDGRTSAKNSETVAHELGHATGLKDLYNYYNQNKLMYGYSSRTASSPTSSDITGARECVKK